MSGGVKMKITEKDIIEALQAADTEPAADEETGLEGTLEKVASVQEVLGEDDMSLADLDDEEALEALAAAGIPEEEAMELVEALMEILGEGEAEEGVDKEAAQEEMFGMGYAYGKGFQAALDEGAAADEGVEKQAASARVQALKAQLFGEKQKGKLGKYKARMARRQALKGKASALLGKAKSKLGAAGKLGLKHKGKIGIGALLAALAGTGGYAAGK